MITLSVILPLAGLVVSSISRKALTGRSRDNGACPAERAERGAVNAHPARSTADRTLSAVSLNLAKETDPAKIVSAIRNTPRLREADVFLFQEVATDGNTRSVADAAARALGYFASFAPAPRDDHQGLALLSRYPLEDVRTNRLKAFDLRFRSRDRFSLSATIRTPWKAVRVWNVHLDTRINAEERLAQLQPVLEDAARQTGPRLIGGDFNTNDLYWLGNILPVPGGPSHGDAVRRAMLKHGFETPLPSGLDTFPPFRRHLDWMFLTGAGSSLAGVEPAPFSDHNAVWVQLHL